MAISEDANLIVSGHFDGSIRRWDPHSGEPVGEPIYNRTNQVNSLAIRSNLIVSGSSDGLLYRYNMSAGEVIGNALQGHEGTVESVAISGH